MKKEVKKKLKIENQTKVVTILKGLKRKYKAQRMILFGSYARGDIHEGSDIDVLLIKQTKEPFVQRIGHVLSLYNGERPIEPLVYTPKEFEIVKDRPFIKTILKEGKEI